MAIEYKSSIIILDFMAQVEPAYECRAMAIRPLTNMSLWADPTLGSNPNKQQKDDLIIFADYLGIKATIPYLLIPTKLYKKAYYSEYTPAIRDAHGRLYLRAKIHRPVIPYKLSPAAQEAAIMASARLAVSVEQWLLERPALHHAES